MDCENIRFKYLLKKLKLLLIKILLIRNCQIKYIGGTYYYIQFFAETWDFSKSSTSNAKLTSEHPENRVKEMDH